MKRRVVYLMIAGLTTIFALGMLLVFGQIKENHTVSGFTGIDASSAFDITVTKGDIETFAIEADDEVMPYVRSEIKNGVLRLYLDKRVDNIKTLKATVMMKNLDNVSLSGFCQLTANDLFTPNSFTGNCSGASCMNVNVNTGLLNIKANGTSKIKIKANVIGGTKMNISGASDIQGELNANNVKVNTNGTCKVNLVGSATDIIIDLSGASNFRGGDFTVKTATIKSTGTSNITINVTDVLNVSSKGSSTVNYKGSPASTAIRSKGASIVRKV